MGWVAAAPPADPVDGRWQRTPASSTPARCCAARADAGSPPIRSRSATASSAPSPSTAPPRSPVTPETASLMGSLAAQAAVALENARLYSETSRRLTETRALLEVAEILNSTLDSRQLLKRVAMKVAQVCRVDRCSHRAVGRRPRGAARCRSSPTAARRRSCGERSRRAGGAAGRDPRQCARHRDAAPLLIDDCATSTLIPRRVGRGLRAARVHDRCRCCGRTRSSACMTLDYCRAAARLPGLAAGSRARHRRPARARRWRTPGSTRRRRSGCARRRTLLAVGRVLSQPGAARRSCMRRVAAEVGARLRRRHGRRVPARRAAGDAGAGGRLPRAQGPARLLPAQPDRARRASPALTAAWRSGRAVGSADVHRDPRFDAEWIARAAAALGAVRADAGPRRGGGRPVPRVVAHRPRLRAGGDAAAGGRRRAGRPGHGERRAGAPDAEQAGGDGDAALGQPRRSPPRSTSRASCGTSCARSPPPSAPTPSASWMVDEDGEWLEPLAGYRVPPDAAGGAARRCGCRSSSTRSTPRPRGPGARCSRRRHATTRACRRSSASGRPHRSQLFVPVVAKDRMIGGFAAVWWERRASSPRASWP